jgi:16S rRNA (adenine(1408)-N(1))-methyltransferase
VGTGDGRAVIESAARQPSTLVIGLDAAAGPMTDASRRSARAVARGGVANALFCIAGIESPPSELVGRADLVTVRFPWGSLFRAVLGIDGAARSGLASLVAPSGAIEALVSVEARDGLPELTDAIADSGGLARTWSDEGFALVDFRAATAEEIAASGSTWARRLGATSVDRRWVVGRGATSVDRRWVVGRGATSVDRRRVVGRGATSVDRRRVVRLGLRRLGIEADRS